MQARVTKTSIFALAAGTMLFSAMAVSPANAAEGRGGRAGIVAQLEALGLDPVAVKADLEGLSRDERIAYLEGLGIDVPDHPRGENGIAAQLTALGLDPETVKAEIAGLDPEARRAYLENLGITLPARR